MTVRPRPGASSARSTAAWTRTCSGDELDVAAGRVLQPQPPGCSSSRRRAGRRRAPGDTLTAAVHHAGVGRAGRAVETAEHDAPAGVARRREHQHAVADVGEGDETLVRAGARSDTCSHAVSTASTASRVTATRPSPSGSATPATVAELQRHPVAARRPRAVGPRRVGCHLRREPGGVVDAVRHRPERVAPGERRVEIGELDDGAGPQPRVAVGHAPQRRAARPPGGRRRRGRGRRPRRRCRRPGPASRSGSPAASPVVSPAVASPVTVATASGSHASTRTGRGRARRRSRRRAPRGTCRPTAAAAPRRRRPGRTGGACPGAGGTPPRSGADSYCSSSRPSGRLDEPVRCRGPSVSTCTSARRRRRAPWPAPEAARLRARRPPDGTRSPCRACRSRARASTRPRRGRDVLDRRRPRR